MIAVGFYKKFLFSLQQECVSQNTFTIATTSITAKTWLITKHFYLIFLQLRRPFLKPVSDLISALGRKKAAYSRRDFKVIYKLILFLHNEELPAGALFTCLWHCWKRGGFCRSLLVAKFLSFNCSQCAVLKNSGKTAWVSKKDTRLETWVLCLCPCNVRDYLVQAKS